ncbi:MAG: acetyltransferase [Bacilli bacterium]|nr:acetyltransferase [Bacilli bacterium]
MKEKLIIIGAGGHSKSVIDSVNQEKYNIEGFLDDNKTGKHMGYPIIGKKLEDIDKYENYKYFVAIGDIVSRKMWFETLKKYNVEIINIIDKTAIISSSSKIGVGNYIGKYAVVNADAVIGNNNVINTKALVEHECIVGNHTHLSTNSVINGNVIIKDCVFLGSSAVCIGQLTVGENSIIGAGSVIISDVEDNVTVVGVPGRVIKKNGNKL